MKHILLAVLFVAFSTILRAQVPPAPDESAQKLGQLNERLLEEAKSKGSSTSPEDLDYRIGAEDLIDIAVFEVPELSRTVRVSAAGEISLPLIGAVKAAGLSPLGLEQLITDRLRQSYVKDPQVSIFMKEFHSEPVSVVGAVKVPGLYQIQTHKSLIEVLAMAQGFDEVGTRLPGRDIIVTRKAGASKVAGALPGDSPTASDASTGSAAASDKNTAEQPEVVEIPIKELMQTGDPKWNIPIYPGDVVKVIPAGTVYVAGDVARPGGFPLTDFDNISVIQALSMAGGTLRTAIRKNSVIIRRDAAGNRVEQKVDLPRVLKGQDSDVMLGPNDILFIPGSTGKAAALQTLGLIGPGIASALVYSHPF